MQQIPKRQSKFIKNTISSLYEVENFLHSTNNIFDILKLIKILKKH